MIVLYYELNAQNIEELKHIYDTIQHTVTKQKVLMLPKYIDVKEINKKEDLIVFYKELQNVIKEIEKEIATSV